MLQAQIERLEAGELPLIGGAASFSNYAEKAILEHAVGRTSWTMPTTYLALCEVVPEDGSTGATITEADYTGYARKSTPNTAWAEASGSPMAIKNDEVLTFNECTAGDSLIKGWALTDNATKGAGNVIAWGTATETTISVTQTPATIAAEDLEITLD